MTPMEAWSKCVTHELDFLLLCNLGKHVIQIEAWSKLVTY